MRNKTIQNLISSWLRLRMPKRGIQKSPTKSPSPKKYKFEEKILYKEPSLWQDTYALIKTLREDRNAPVDSMGAEVLSQTEYGKEVYQFQVMCSLLLSSLTKDQKTQAAIRALQANIKPFFCAEALCSVDESDVQDLIKGVGFYKTKAKNLKKVAIISHERYNGGIPQNVRELVSEFPGIGPKMAFITINVAFGEPIGIGVDSHVLRISNQLKWADSKDAEIVRKQLESWLPKDNWLDYNVLLVGLGQQIQQKAERKKLIKKISRLPLEDQKKSIKLLKKLGFKEKFDQPKHE